LVVSISAAKVGSFTCDNIASTHYTTGSGTFDDAPSNSR
jgi:hypothetical protein